MHIFGVMDIVFSKMLNNYLTSVRYNNFKNKFYFTVKKDPFVHRGKSSFASRREFCYAASRATDGQILVEPCGLFSLM